jgi:hypothetical protein
MVCVVYRRRKVVQRFDTDGFSFHRNTFAPDFSDGGKLAAAEKTMLRR